MYKTAVIGDETSVQCFKAIGVQAFPAIEQREIIRTLRRLENENYGVIFITEEAAELAESELNRMAENPVPAVIPVPGVSGNTGKGMNSLKSYIEKAVGSDILGD